MTMPNGKNFYRNVTLADLVRICDFGAIPKFNMTPRAICGIRLAELHCSETT
jgi:hypothetical protein